ncbi:hypothetical protein [Streptomyces zhihengii]|uniref:Uncharacterized protein n=1 Tax=Streptomyces zhihengii TaxID=1818004 RepID=A0ABS2V3T6_9ACTN|nr:hypothetical protein [Streptomyces zhihengii]MBM9624501.1 hypothetical protein [Streptomyces zhihengii]
MLLLVVAGGVVPGAVAGAVSMLCASVSWLAALVVWVLVTMPPATLVTGPVSVPVAVRSVVLTTDA